MYSLFLRQMCSVLRFALVSAREGFNSIGSKLEGVLLLKHNSFGRFQFVSAGCCNHDKPKNETMIINTNQPTNQPTNKPSQPVIDSQTGRQKRQGNAKRENNVTEAQRLRPCGRVPFRGFLQRQLRGGAAPRHPQHQALSCLPASG